MSITEYIPVVLDVFLVGTAVFFVLRGRRLGLLKMLLSTVGAGLAAFAGRVVSAPLGSWIYDTFVERGLISEMEERLNNTSKGGIEALMAAVPDSVAKTAESYNFNLESLFGNVGVKGLDNGAIAEKVAETVFKPILTPALSLLAMAVVTIILSGIVATVVSNLKIFKKENSVLSMTDRLLGMLFGLAKGAVVAIAAALLFSALASLFSDSAIAQAVAGSKLIPVIASFVI